MLHSLSTLDEQCMITKEQQKSVWSFKPETKFPQY